MDLSARRPFALPSSPHPALIWAAMGLLLLVAVLNAWVSDDAYITFRSVFNLTHGYGPVYNPGERVQTFTNPLWMLVMSAAYVFTGEAFFTCLVLSWGFMLAGAWLIARRILDMGWSALGMLLLMAVSVSFVEYSTSGLENVLNFFLIAWFLTLWLRGDDTDRRLFWMAFVAALGVVSRMDTLLLYLPALAWAWWGRRSLRSLWLVAAGFAPFILWEVFSVVYYGFPFPNTAYAKLNAGITSSQFLQQGLKYYAFTFRNDPVTLAVMAAGLFSVLRLPRGKWWPVAAGMALYMVYILRIGGDFMGGRFMYLPFALGAVCLAAGLQDGTWFRWASIPLLLIGILNPRAPQYYWAKHIEGRVAWQDGIADERAWYYSASALIDLTADDWSMETERLLDKAVANPKGKQNVLVWDCIGYTGYGVGPETYVVDRFALADPLMARLPMSHDPEWRVGHLSRVMPYGYLRTLRSGQNQIEDTALAEYYDKLMLVTRAPLFAPGRWEAIWKFNTGQYQHLIDWDLYHYPSPSRLPIDSLPSTSSKHAAWNAPGHIILWARRAMDVDLPSASHQPLMDVGFSTRTNLYVTYRLDHKDVATDTLHANWAYADSISHVLHAVNPLAVERGYDQLSIQAGGGNDHYALSHLRLLDRKP